MPLQYQNILVAVDGSNEADLAFKKSMGIASRNKSHLYLVHIIDNQSFGSVEAYSQAIAKEAMASSEKLMAGYKQAAISAGAENVHVVIEYGSPKKLIPVDLVKKYNIDLIICGATGLNAAERIFLGSVSERIIRAAHCDVLVVRTEDHESVEA